MRSRVDGKVTCAARLPARWSRQLHQSILVSYQMGRPNIDSEGAQLPSHGLVCLKELVSDFHLQQGRYVFSRAHWLMIGLPAQKLMTGFPLNFI